MSESPRVAALELGWALGSEGAKEAAWADQRGAVMARAWAQALEASLELAWGWKRAAAMAAASEPPKAVAKVVPSETSLARETGAELDWDWAQAKALGTEPAWVKMWAEVLARVLVTLREARLV